jgi:hypothetical protein
LSSFLTALVPEISDLGGHVEQKSRSGSPRHVATPLYTNSVIEEIINALLKCLPELMPARCDAEIILIPPFLKAGLLKVPNKPPATGEGSKATDGGLETKDKAADVGYVMLPPIGKL